MNNTFVMNDVDKQDILMAVELEKFLVSPLGLYLKRNWQMKREALLHEGKKCAKDNSDRFWGLIDGFDRAVVMPHEIIETVRRNRKQKKEVVPNGAFQNEDE